MRMFFAALASVLLVLLVSCKDATPQFKGSDITGTRLGKDLALTGTDGKAYTLEALKG